jgi:hypothetical protein
MKFLNLLFVLAIMFSFAACETKPAGEEGDKKDSTTVEQPAPTAPETTVADTTKKEGSEEKKDEKKAEK